MVTRPAWIETIDESDADGELAAAFTQSGDRKTGKVDYIMKVHSLNPQSMLDHDNLYTTLMYGRSPLKRYQREMIATVVSALNECHY